MSVHSLNPKFLSDYKISSFFQAEKQGGQKTVYFPVIEGEKFALKFFPGGQDDRFDREMEIYEKFKDLEGIPKIIKIEKYGKDLIVFEEFIEGDTLIDIVVNYKNDSDKVKKLIRDIFDIMKPIWEARYVHRDIKPANIIIKNTGAPVIIDFGIARDLGASSITGTGWQPKSWMFASPEQFSGEKDKISYRTDFFSIGVLTYYLFHQRLPFGNSEAEVANKFKSKEQSFSVDSLFKLQEFCDETMKFSPAERPRKIDDLLNLL